MIASPAIWVANELMIFWIRVPSVPCQLIFQRPNKACPNSF